MNLSVPTVSVAPGPSYASAINSDLTLIDAHDHSTGKGVPITPNGLNINANLPFSGNNATQLRTVRFQAQVSPVTGSSTADVGCVYVAGVDLYYNDVDGNQVRITSGGGVAGSPGSITNLASPATATYVSASSKFVWQSDVNVAADMDMRSAVLRNSTPSSFGLTLSAPTMPSDQTQTFPATPGASSFMTMDASGAMATSITTALGITRPMQAAVGQQTSTSSAFFTTVSASYEVCGTMSLTLTTTGRPVMLMLISDGNASTAAAFGQAPGTTAEWAFFRDSTNIGGNTTFIGSGPVGTILYPPGAMTGLDTPAAGTYTYTFRARASGGGSVVVSQCRLLAYEL